jgi:FtsP/CotA-like multicopper oxidase with cupredoxin domain
VANENLPDMHPFHVHLVNGVVTRRWDLDPTSGAFVPANTLAPDIDAVARQDTVLIPSNQIIELLVYFPKGYSGKYAYHCHLLEHEDMCMMSHFEVVA